MVRVLDRGDVRCLMTMADAIAAVREALTVADRGGAAMPAPFGMYLPGAGGEVGIQDAAVAALAARIAAEHGAAQDVPLGEW